MRTQRRPGGMTLTEVLVALSILAFAMVPILKALTQAHVNSRRIEQKSTSWLLARSQLEALRGRAFADWDSSWQQSHQSLGQGYYGTITDSGSTGDLRTIRVQTGYDENGDQQLNAEEVEADLSGLIARCD